MQIDLQKRVCSSILRAKAKYHPQIDLWLETFVQSFLFFSFLFFASWRAILYCFVLQFSLSTKIFSRASHPSCLPKKKETQIGQRLHIMSSCLCSTPLVFKYMKGKLIKELKLFGAIPNGNLSYSQVYMLDVTDHHNRRWKNNSCAARRIFPKSICWMLGSAIIEQSC